MAKEKLTEEQKLRRRIHRLIEGKKNFLDANDVNDYRGIISEFLEKYCLIEAAIKKVIEKKKEKETGKKVEIEQLTISISEIKSALKFAGITSISDADIDVAFKKNNAKGSKSARDLRNEIVHAVSEPAIQEVVSRRTILNEALDRIIVALTAEPLN